MAHLGPGRILRVAIVLSLLVGVIGLTDVPASALTARTVSGTVACENGNQVVGVWINSSAGDSKFATVTPRSQTPWIADYTASIATAASSTTIRLDIGCGIQIPTISQWWSNNPTATKVISGSTSLSAFCKEAAGTATGRCKWWGKTALVGMPFTGYWACPKGSTVKWCESSPSSDPKAHHGAGDWTVDLYANATKVEAQHPQVGADERPGQRSDHRILTGSAIERVGMADDCAARCVGRGEEISFEHGAVGAFEVHDSDIDGFHQTTLPVA